LSNQQSKFNLIMESERASTHNWYEYWREFSSFNTWQFWLLVFLFIIPLVIVYLKIDRKRALQIGFYGFNIHVWLSYIDRYGTYHGYWGYPYQMIIQFPNIIVLDSSLVPVLFMFVYQWTIKNGKSFYIYTTLLCFFLAFIFRPIMHRVNLIEFYNGANYLHFFIGYLVIMVLSKFITEVFINFVKRE
jgi:hypothetical protein